MSSKKAYVKFKDPRYEPQPVKEIVLTPEEKELTREKMTKQQLRVFKKRQTKGVQKC